MLKFLIIFFSIIYLGGILVRWFMRKWIKNITQQGPNNSSNNIKEEGEVSVKYEAGSNKKRNSGEGDYIDYEEVK